MLITLNFDPTKIESSFLKFSELRDMVRRIRAPYLFRNVTDLTTAIFTGCASTVPISLKNNALKCHFWCYPGNDTCLSVLLVPFLEFRSYFSCSKTPKFG